MGAEVTEARRGGSWTVLAAAAVGGIALVDALTGNRVILTGLLLLPVLALAAVASAREVSALGLVATVLAALTGVWNENLPSADYFVRLVVVAVGSALAVRAAHAMSSAVEATRRERATQQRLDGILHGLAEAVTVHDERGKTVYANDAAARLLGAASVAEVLAAEPGELAARFRITTEDGSPVTLEDLPGYRLLRGERAPSLLTRSVAVRTGEARWLLTKASRIEDEHGRPLAINIIEDVTEAKEAELRRRFLDEAGQLLASSLDYEETLERVAQLAVPWLADWCAVDVPDGRGGVRQVAVAHVDPDKVALAHELRRRYPPDMDAPTGMPAVLRTGEAELIREIPDALVEAAARDAEHLRIIRELGLCAAMVVPMRIGGETLGVISFVSAESGRTFDEDDLAFAQDLALRAAGAVRNARLYDEQLRLSQTLQRSLLPERLPDVPGWELAASYDSGDRRSEVGGDFYDVVPAREGWLAFLGDVTGKGVEAAALTALVRHTTQIGARFDRQPSEIVALANRVLHEQARLAPVSLACVHLNGDTACTVCGGHPLPLLKREGEPVRPVGRHDLLLGVMPDATWEEVPLDLEPGDLLLLYTDGVTDTPGEGERFGEERLVAAVERAPADPSGVIAEVDAAIRAFRTGTVTDDRAMLALRYVG